MTDVVGMIQTGMQIDVDRLQVIGQNLANLSTVGYKREAPVVQAFSQALDNAGELLMGHASASPYPALKTHTDHSAGALKYTGSPLDLGIEGAAFFVVRTELGEAYTRQGNFQRDTLGRLVTATGAVVQGTGGDVQLTTTTPRIDESGGVWDGANQVGTLSLVRVSNPETLIKAGQGLYVPGPSTEVAHTEGVRVRQGYLEAANVVAMDEMIRIIETVRHFEASQRLMRGYDAMLDRAINVLGE
jgi:flagellar basal body rod protein FlgG